MSDGVLRREVNPEETKCEDWPVKLWASGLRERGKKTLWYLAEEDRGMVSSMWVGADEESGSGIVVAGKPCFPCWKGEMEHDADK